MYRGGANAGKFRAEYKQNYFAEIFFVEPIARTQENGVRNGESRRDVSCARAHVAVDRKK